MAGCSKTSWRVTERDGGAAGDEVNSVGTHCDGPERAPRTVLVVDDQQPARRLVSHALRRCCRVLEAAGPDHALATLASARVDVVLLDLHFPPDVDSPLAGLRAFGAIHGRWPEVPVLIATSDDDAALRRTLLEHGARAYFVKPVDVKELSDTVCGLLGGSRAAVAPGVRETSGGGS